MRSIALLGMIGLLPLSSIGLAGAGEARLYLAPYVYPSNLSGEAQVTDSVTGTMFDLEDTLGMDPHETVIGVDGFVKFLGSRINFGYSQSEHSGDTRLEETVTFNDQTFTVGDRVRSDLELKRYKLMYGFDFGLKVVNVGILVGAQGVDASARLRSEVSGLRETEEFRGAIPVLGVTLGIHPVSKIAIHAEASGLSLTISGVKVKLIDAFAGVDWYFVPKIGLKAGYRYFLLDAEDDDESDGLELDQNGPFVGLAVHL